MELTNPYLDKQSFSGQIYEFIKKEIYDQRLMPGEKINIRQLAQKLNCSIVPVREALSRLHAEKLIELAPYRGYVVTPLLDIPSFLNLFEVRMLLERKAVELAVPKITNGDILEMEEIIKQGNICLGDHFTYDDFKPFTGSDFKFHRFIFQIANNEFLLEAWLNLRFHLHLSRLYFQKGCVYVVPATKGHEEIIAAFRSRDLQKTLAALDNHLMGASNRLFPRSQNETE